jgi:hypothetical protein
LFTLGGEFVSHGYHCSGDANHAPIATRTRPDRLDMPFARQAAEIDGYSIPSATTRRPCVGLFGGASTLQMVTAARRERPLMIQWPAPSPSSHRADHSTHGASASIRATP